MKTNLLKKITESVASVLPVALIVFILNFTPLINLSSHETLVFLICTLLLILGMSLFNLGADLAMTPMGDKVGAGLTKSKKLTLLLLTCFALGVLITIAEPDLSVLAGQVKDKIDPTLLVVTVGLGVGVFLVLAVLKMIFNRPLSTLLMYFYALLFALTALLFVNGNGDFLALAFDSGGVTTGPITVPFIMALGVGIASTIGGKNSKENSFGHVALCSVGPILAVILLGTFSSGNIEYALPDYSVSENVAKALLSTSLSTAKEVALALGMIVLFFLILQITTLKLPAQKLGKIAIGVLYTFVGLVVFLTAVSVGFMPIGYKIGEQLGNRGDPALLVITGFILGLVVVLAEPAVHVLNKQVEEITDSTVSRKSMMIALSVGVGISIALSMLRIVLKFNILYYLIPGYFISLGLSFFVPGLYTAIAFDSGGVASGPLTSSFILPLAIGVCCSVSGVDSVMTDAFGIVAMVAMTPLITIQMLGFKAVVSKKVRDKAIMRKILHSNDGQIINFM